MKLSNAIVHFLICPNSRIEHNLLLTKRFESWNVKQTQLSIFICSGDKSILVWRIWKFETFAEFRKIPDDSVHVLYRVRNCTMSAMYNYFVQCLRFCTLYKNIVPSTIIKKNWKLKVPDHTISLRAANSKQSQLQKEMYRTKLSLKKWFTV